MKGSSHELQLKQLQQKYPDLKWQAVSETDDDELMRDVASGKLDFTVADSVDVALIQRIHPDIAIAMELTYEEPISWFVKNSSNDNLYALIIEFLVK